MIVKDYIYDFEIYPNFIGVTFIPENIKSEYLDAYINADIKFIDLKNKLSNNIDTSKDIEEVINHKKAILQAMGAKQFVIWNSVDGTEFRNDLMLLEQFFTSHKTITGYNSNDYDQVMLSILLYEAKYVESNGYHYRHKRFITDMMYRHSQDCIGSGKGYYYQLGIHRKFKRPFTNYDIQKILYLDKSFTSLKQIAIILKWHRIQDLPIPFYKPISEDEIDEIMDYNVNDDLITLKLKRTVKDEIDLRESLSNEFGINFRNMSRSSIGKAITIKLYSEYSGKDKSEFIDLRTNRRSIHVDDLISDKVEFQTPTLKNLLTKIRKQTILVGSKNKENSFKHEVKFGDNIYTMALGGLHSKDNPGIIIVDPTKKRLVDSDVASYYPRGIVLLKICPEHLELKPFITTVKVTADTRVDAKHKSSELQSIISKAQSILLKEDISISKRSVLQSEIERMNKIADSLKTKSEGLKIAINRMYGAFKDINDFLYDPFCTYKTTINLQLFLLMLIEDFELNKLKVVSANTDGVVTEFPIELTDIYNKVCDNWQKKLGFELEFTDYERYLRNDVNNYIAIKTGFENAYENLIDSDEYKQSSDSDKKDSIKAIEKKYIKRKGLFLETLEFNRGYNYPVVAKALNLQCIYDIPYHDVIENHIKSSKFAIYDYCMSQKSDKKFTIYYDHLVDGKLVRETLQKSNRFYISNDKIGTIIKHDNEAAGTKESRMVAKQSVIPFNNYIYQDTYDINFSFYKKECNKIIEGKNKKTKGIFDPQQSMNLFDNDCNDLLKGTIDVYESPAKLTARRKSDVQRAILEELHDTKYDYLIDNTADNNYDNYDDLPY